MHIRSLSLRHFRTYNRLEIDFPAAPILLIGANAQGKTSLLEAIAYLSAGSSPLTNIDQHIIHWQAIEAGMPFTHMQTEVVRREGTEHIEIAVQKAALSNGNSRLKKSIRINQKTVRRSELSGHLNVILFTPEDVELIGGSPSKRRRHIDRLLSQIYPTYVEALSTYEQALSKRNALLRHLRDAGSSDPQQLAPLEKILCQQGVVLSLYRQRVIGALNTHADRIHQELTGGKAWLNIQYQPNFDTLKPPALDYQMGLLPETAKAAPVDTAALQDAYREMMERRRKHALQRGVTLVGPHRDEIRFISEGVDLGTFGSRGQQRTAVLAMRLAELHWLQQETGESPVLLLDEVLAELDRARRNYLLNLLGNVEQTIMATTDAEMFPAKFRENTLMLEVKNGIISPVEHS